MRLSVLFRVATPILTLALLAGVATPAAAAVATVYTWGNSAGDSPVVVSGAPLHVKEVQASNYAGFLLDSEGNVWQWTNRPTPAIEKVKGPSDVVSVGEGDRFGAAVTSAGKLWVWGDNIAGDLCLGIAKSKNGIAPKLVPGVNNAVAVSGGGGHLLILLSTGRMKACGENTLGELGNDTFTSSDVPVNVIGVNHVTAISSGSDTSMALESDGNVYNWGDNNFGQLGNGTTTNSDMPVQVPLEASATEIFAGGSLSTNGQEIALLSDGSVWAWGNDAWGQLGNGITESFSATPVEATALPAGHTWTYVASGGQSSFALDSNGEVWAWGDDSLGELGDGNDTGYVVTPEQVASGYSQISAVAAHFAGLAT